MGLSRMNIIVHRENWHLISKLEKIFSDDETVEFIVDRRSLKRERSPQDLSPNRRQTDPQPTRKYAIWS